MTEIICSWCDPNPHREGDHTICESCLERLYGDESQDGPETLLSGGTEAGLVGGESQ